MARFAPLGGLVLIGTLAALIVAPDAQPPPALALGGLAALALGGLVTTGRPLWVMVGGAAPGAFLVSIDAPVVVEWLPIALGVAIVISAPLATDVDQRWRRVGIAPILYAITAVGIYLCVPDTEDALALVVVALAAAALSRFPSLRVYGSVATPPIVGLLLWVAAEGARGRPAAFVGAVGALGLLALEPLGVRFRGARPPWLGGTAAVLTVIVAQTGLVAYASRVVGLEHDAVKAIVLLAPALLAGIAVGRVAGRSVPEVSRCGRRN